MAFRVQEQNRSMWHEHHHTPSGRDAGAADHFTAAPMISRTMVLDLPVGPPDREPERSLILRIDAQAASRSTDRSFARVVLVCRACGSPRRRVGSHAEIETTMKPATSASPTCSRRRAVRVSSESPSITLPLADSDTARDNKARAANDPSFKRRHERRGVTGRRRFSTTPGRANRAQTPA